MPTDPKYLGCSVPNNYIKTKATINIAPFNEKTESIIID
jgi:hypothetical protein